MATISISAWQDAERAAITRFPEDQLMLLAGRRMADALFSRCPETLVRAIIWLGKGNNAGDAITAAIWLRRWGWQIQWRLLDDSPLASDSWSLPTQRRWREFQAEFPSDFPAAILSTAPDSEITNPPAFPGEIVRLAADPHPSPLPPSTRARSEPVSCCDGVPSNPPPEVFVAIDGILGLGARGNLHGPALKRAREINQFHQACNARVFAIDFPTGWQSPEGVNACETLMVGAARQELLADGMENRVGRISIIPMPEITACVPPDVWNSHTDVSSVSWFYNTLPRRRFSCHKGQAGRVAILAGSPGMAGAAALAALGALHGGAGIVSLFVPEPIYLPVVSLSRPEVMVVPVSDYFNVDLSPFDAVVAGPGMGNLTPDLENSLFHSLARFPGPLVLDAQMFSLAAYDRSMNRHDPSIHPDDWRSLWSKRCVLTPHPGEMQRVWPHDQELDRRSLAEAFTSRYPATLHLKGSRSLTVSQGNGQPRVTYNSTGGPHLASPGHGDVLAGTIGALLAFGLDPHAAAAAAAFWRG